MEKFKTYLLGGAIMLGFIFLAWFLYEDFASTTAIILNITLLMVGLMIAVTVVNRGLNKKNSIVVDKAHYPTIENDLIYVKPEGFCLKLKKYKGHIYMISEEMTEEATITSASYNKLTDQVEINYTHGLKTFITGVKYFSVGDYQFMVHKFDTLLHIKGGKKIVLSWSGNKLEQVDGEDTIPIKINHKTPVFIFDWSDLPDQFKDIS